ncbi:MAG: class I SAM-dependent methyltransferase [Candidatus Paceibacterota bacterium]|jgi:16S rRNA (guanine1207-N2)-methyltransferase
MKSPIENLPLKLLSRHEGELGLKNPLVIDTEATLFETRITPTESAIVFLPKSKTLIDMTLALVSGMVVEGGVIILAGTNDAGIRSANLAYEKNIGPVEQKIVGNHSALYVGKNKRLSAGKKLADFLSFAALSYKEAALQIANLPGVFNAGELDAGTKLLLDTIPYDRTRVLDIGCGAGIIGAIYKKTNPSSDITLSDASILATEASRQTLAKNGLQGTVILSDVFANIKGTFDLILANPPFHTGISTDYSFIESFVVNAGKHLNRNGEIYVVANSFLPYREKLERNIGPTTLAAETPKFIVWKTMAR